MDVLHQALLSGSIKPLLWLAFSHAVDLLLVALACWTLVKCQRRPRVFWWFLAALGCEYLRRHGLSNLGMLIDKIAPGVLASGLSNSGRSLIQLVLGTLHLVVSLVLMAGVWWCVLQAAFDESSPPEMTASLLESTSEEL